jgi:hypothetical protein
MDLTMNFKLLTILLLVTSSTLSLATGLSGISRLERIGTFYEANNSSVIMSCTNDSGESYQVKLTTVEYIIILSKSKNKDNCSFKIVKN